MGAGPGAQAWVLSAMNVGTAAGLLSSGEIGDDYRRRRTFLAGAANVVLNPALGRQAVASVPAERAAMGSSVDDSEDAYGRTLAYVYLDTNKDGSYEHLFNEDLIELGLARTTTFSHERRREFERLQEEAEERGSKLWGACPEIESYQP